MEPKTGQKPINVLSEYLTLWIRANSEEALPFDSFENLLPHPIAQKTVERWIFNCNYLYNRVGDLFYDNDLLPDNRAEREALISDIEGTFKTISEHTPLNLRAKLQTAVAYELSRDWPPFSTKSRNTVSKFERMVAAYSKRNPRFCTEHAQSLDALHAQILDEAAFYAALADHTEADAHALVTRCRALLPIWCAKEINPLMTLLIWSDQGAVTDLVKTLARAFRESPDFMQSDGSIDRWREATLEAQRAYIDSLDDDTDLTGLSVRQIGELLTARGFTLDTDERRPGLPRWLVGKSRLIWNIVVCAILGPSEAIGGGLVSRSSTASIPHRAAKRTHDECLSGEVLLRRRFSSGRVETVGRIDTDRVCAPGLWKVIGSVYDARAALPNSGNRERLAAPGTAFVQTRTFDERDAATEGVGDSRFHLELEVSLDKRDRATIIARDLNSKNGTWVLRVNKGTAPSEPACYVMAGRCGLTTREWSERLGVSGEQIEFVRELALERGDIINLPGSCFELV